MENYKKMGKIKELTPIELYISKVSYLLPYPMSKKKDALDELRIDVQSAMRDSEGELPSSVFGDPLDVARNISQSCS